MSVSCVASSLGATDYTTQVTVYNVPKGTSYVIVNGSGYLTPEDYGQYQPSPVDIKATPVRGGDKGVFGGTGPGLLVSGTQVTLYSRTGVAADPTTVAYFNCTDI